MYNYNLFDKPIFSQNKLLSFEEKAPYCQVFTGSDVCDLLGSTFIAMNRQEIENFIKNQRMQERVEYMPSASPLAPFGVNSFEKGILRKIAKNRELLTKEAKLFFEQQGVKITDTPSAKTEISQDDALIYYMLFCEIKEDRSNLHISYIWKEYKELVLDDIKTLLMRASGRQILLAVTRLPIDLKIQESRNIGFSVIDGSYVVQFHHDEEYYYAASGGYKCKDTSRERFIVLGHECLHALLQYHCSRRLNRFLDVEEKKMNACFHKYLLGDELTHSINSLECNFNEALVIDGHTALPFWPSENILRKEFDLPLRFGHRGVEKKSFEKARKNTVDFLQACLVHGFAYDFEQALWQEGFPVQEVMAHFVKSSIDGPDLSLLQTLLETHIVADYLPELLQSALRAKNAPATELIIRASIKKDIALEKLLQSIIEIPAKKSWFSRFFS